MYAVATGHKDNGDRWWTWCSRAELHPGAPGFKIDSSRGSEVLVNGLGEEFDGVPGGDDFSAYRKYMANFSIAVSGRAGIWLI